MYKYIIFDIDGTLIDTEIAIICALQKLLQSEKNRIYSPEELHFILGIPGKEALKELQIDNPDVAISKWNEYLTEYVSCIQLFPDIERVIKQLHEARIRTGIVTSKTRTEYTTDFIPFGLNQYFQFVVCADDTVHHKPQPEPLIKSLKMASAKPKEAIYIGDTIYDSQCAAAAGVDFALALWGTRNKNIPSRYHLASPLDIPELLNMKHLINK
jgi:HAD superfamily hydrolase (TIGR01549 family)